MQFDHGYISPYFVTNADKMRVEMDDAYILINEKKLSSLNEPLPLLEAVVQTGRPLVIVAEDVEGGDLHTATQTVDDQGGERFRRQGAGLRRSPQGHAAGHRDPDRRPGHLGSPRHIKLENVNLSMLARAKKVMIDKENTTIVSGADKKADIEARVQQIKAQIEETTSDYDREIAINAGEDGSVIVGKILEKDQYSYGFDSLTGEYANLVSNGIIDRTKVVRTAIQNAASVAALLITKPFSARKKKKSPAAMSGLSVSMTITVRR